MPKQHNNFKNDMEKLHEAYGNINKANNEEPGKAHKYTVIENDKEVSIQPMEYSQPKGDLIKTVKSDGIVKTCYEHPDGREWTVESDKEIDFNQEGSWTWNEDGEEETFTEGRSSAHGARPKLQGVKVYR